MTLRRSFRRMGAALLAVAAVPVWSQVPPDLGAFLDGVAARLEKTAAYENWTASTIQTITETDRAGRPEKVTVLTKAVRVADGRRREEVLKAIETEDGRSRDITSQTLAQSRERREREERRRDGETRPESGRRADGRRGGWTDIENLLPFSRERRADFQFALRETGDAAGRRLVLLDVKARTKDLRNWDGTFTIDPVAFDILHADIRPSKMPRFVKDLAVEADIEVLDGKHFVFKRTKFKVNGGFLFLKRVRMTVEEEYSDVRVLDLS